MGTPSWEDVEVGDEIVAEVHGVVRKISTTRWQIDVEPDRSAMTRGVFPMTDTLKSIEKPVRTFKPGDKVRAKDYPDRVYTIGVGGFFDNETYQWSDWDLTPLHYELVED